MFSSEEIEGLLKNENVSRCSDKSITYGKNFKLSAIRLYEQGLTSAEIFRQAGFNIDTIGKDQPTTCLRRWNKIYKTKGLEKLSIETRGKGGGRPKTKNITDADKIKRLEIENAYLKAENDFLAKLRAKRRE